MISMIVAMDKNGLIGKDGGLPWKIPDDLNHFKEVTRHHTVIMGMNTYESIGKPLPFRDNIVLSRHNWGGISRQRLYFHQTVEQALSFNSIYLKCANIFVIGGAKVYEEFAPLCSKLFITHIDGEYEGDVYFPLDVNEYLKQFSPPLTVREFPEHRAKVCFYERRLVKDW